VRLVVGVLFLHESYATFKKATSSKMENVSKGDLYEKQALSIINKMFEDGDLIFLKDNARIFTKKKYPSIYRDHVTFDITIELWAPNAERYSMIYFIECKHYSKRIPVAQIQKFHNDIQQVSGVNAKGIFISNMPFRSRSKYWYDGSARRFFRKF
jgi:hypothetical protein